jgi:hypothetical protein
MAISVVATGSTASAVINGANVTLNVSSLQQDDIIIVVGGICGTAAGTQGVSGNNSGAFQNLNTTDTGANQFFAGWQRMGATPDTVLTGTGNGDTGDTTGYACITLRGASTATPPTDATSTTANTTGTNPNPASIDWATAGTAIVVGYLSVVNDAAGTAPSGYANETTWIAGANDGEDCSVAIAYDLTPGADPEDPGTFGSIGSGAWRTITIAIKEAVATVTGSWMPIYPNSYSSGIDIMGY